MKNPPKKRITIMAILILLFTSLTSYVGQTNPEVLTGKDPVYPEKSSALNYLSSSPVIEKYGRISDSIWSMAELGMQEFMSAELLASTLEAEGFTVERGAAGMPTCFVASWGSGKPVIGILGEFDALPGISQKAGVPYQSPLIAGGPGHGCGHNLMGTAGIAAAIAVKKSMEEHNIGGTIRFYGSPAEETVISRPYMVRAGLFSDVDAVIDNHASSGFSTSYGVSGNALISVIFTFTGRTAHSGGSPWAGRSALDAVEIMNVATNYLREHLHFTHRMHYVIMDGGEAPNVVPDKASVWYYVRNTDERIRDMYDRVVDCAKGAALATGTELSDINVLTGIHQKHSNRALATVLQKNIDLIGMPEWSEEEHAFARALQRELGAAETGYPERVSSLRSPAAIQTGGGSTDVGEVSLVAPTATVSFPGNVPGAISHHWSAVAAYHGTAAWKGLNAGAKVMAATAIDLLTDNAKLEEIKEEFREYSKTRPYKPLLPDDATPPLFLNRELMEKYRR